MPGDEVRDVEEVEPPPENERGEHRTVDTATAPERSDPDEGEQVDRGARHEAERAVKEEAGYAALGCVVQDLLLVADEEVPRARYEPPEEPPVEIAEQEHQREEWQRRGKEAAHEVAPRPKRGVRDDEAEPDRDEPPAGRQPRQRPNECAREREVAHRCRGAMADQTHDGHEHHRGNEVGVDLRRVREEGMHEDRRRDGEERDPSIECEIA